MEIKRIMPGDVIWDAAADYAAQSQWGAGPELAQKMRDGDFHDYECVFIAMEGDDFAGYCTLRKTGCLKDVPYTPYAGFVFVDERFRGNRLSEKLVNAAVARAAELGFGKVYLISGHVGLYEKYGFTPIDQRPAPWDPERIERVFIKNAR